MMVTLLSVVIIALYLLAGVIWFARRRPEYRHIHHTISELGEAGAPDARLVSYGLFAPVGAGLLLLGGLSHPAEVGDSLRGAFGALAIAVGIGYLGAALFPCDPGSPLTGSKRQQIHNLAGGIEYLGAAFALFNAGQLLPEASFLRWWFVFSTWIAAGAAIALSITPARPLRGLLQRGAEIVIFGNLILLAWLG
ncbi:MAG: DUF998 domain-containing protein [Oscillochloris sp.]|nr:DUF998 domain-containing protein [Oscillochloris sp.]